MDTVPAALAAVLGSPGLELQPALNHDPRAGGAVPAKGIRWMSKRLAADVEGGRMLDAVDRCPFALRCNPELAYRYARRRSFEFGRPDQAANDAHIVAVLHPYLLSLSSATPTASQNDRRSYGLPGTEHTGGRRLPSRGPPSWPSPVDSGDEEEAVGSSKT